MCEYAREDIFLEEAPNSDLLKEEVKIEAAHDYAAVKEESSDKTSFQCEVCSKSYTTMSRLEEHLVQHVKEPLKCDQCPKAYKCKRSFHQHKALVHENKSRVSCEVCGKNFLYRAQLKQHMERHSKGRNHKCGECGCAFRTKGDLTKHTNIFHPTETPFQCEVCSKSFSTLPILRLHSVKHNEEKPFKCGQCSDAFKWKTSLNNHKVLVHSGGGEFPCEVCGKKLLYKAKYKLHMERHGKEKNHKCGDCGYAAKTKGDLTKHINIIHPAETPFQCEVCSKSFSLLSILRRHSSSHREEKPDDHYGVKPFKCDQCPTAYNGKQSLRVHKAMVHENKSRASCELCGKKFFYRGQLVKHMEWHGSEKNHKCGECARAFKTKFELTCHVYTWHATETPFQCKVCSKNFPTSSLLKRHSINHGEEKPYKCDQCSDAYKCQTSLKEHRAMVHDNKSRFSCEACGKKFFFLAKLNEHMERYHSDEKNHKCTKCGIGFKTKGYLRKHIAIWHPTEALFRCEVCSKSFSTLSLLKRHSLNHDESEPPNSATNIETFEEVDVKVEPTVIYDPEQKQVKQEHDTERNHKCRYCGCAFKSKANLCKHYIVSHPNETPFPCEVCSKSFSSLSLLKKHSARHKEAKAFKCDQCSVSCKQKKYLDNHKVMVHGGGGKFACGVCGKKFLFPAKLKDHVENHSSEKNHKCCECGRSFKRKYELNCHVKATHATETPFYGDVKVEPTVIYDPEEKRDVSEVSKEVKEEPASVCIKKEPENVEESYSNLTLL